MAPLEPPTEVADGVPRCGSERVNWYLVEGTDELTVVDTGLPAHSKQLFERLDALGYDGSDVAACILTHAHPDHIGFAQRLHESADVPVWLHEAGVERAREGGDPPLSGFVKNLWRPAVLRYFVETVRSGGTSIPPLMAVETFADGDELDLPGRPQVIHVPGHTEDEVAFYLPDRDVLLCGDAFATVDFETWQGHATTPAGLARRRPRAGARIDHAARIARRGRAPAGTRGPVDRANGRCHPTRP
jgi:glyoxylase-like metal-dependent hydrolase (beta-lactamase superfamily II)